MGISKAGPARAVDWVLAGRSLEEAAEAISRRWWAKTYERLAARSGRTGVEALVSRTELLHEACCLVAMRRVRLNHNVLLEAAASVAEQIRVAGEEPGLSESQQECRERARRAWRKLLAEV